MNILNTISGPIIGGVIGYFTNYIAIKMLFRPLNPIRIGKYTLPFTPGVVPKRKDMLGGVLGSAIMDKFFTYDDLEEIFLSDYFKNAVTGSVLDHFYSDEEVAQRDSLSRTTNEHHDQLITNLKDTLCIRILAGFIKADIPEIIASEGPTVIKKNFNKGPLGKLLTDDMISSITKPLGEGAQEYILKNGRRFLMPILDRELEELSNQSVCSIINDLEIEKDLMAKILYIDFIRTRTRKIVEHIDIGGIIESKVQNMNPLELEDLTLSVVNRELHYVVILGAIIGVIIGSVNIFI